MKRLLSPLLLAGLLLLLAACASTSGGPDAPVASSTKPETRPVPPAKPATPPPAKRGGGYYQDDGPDENPPDNLDAVPDAAPRKEPLHRFANNPYNVLGQSYVPHTALKPYKARGIASWYGRKFHGRKTSSGERYDMYGMTAAHPTLPIPSYARITNLANGRSVVVRVNDRGPFHSNRLIDLSYTAAYKLGYIKNGSTQVEVEAIFPEGVDVIEANIPPVRTKAGTAALAEAERNAAQAPAPAHVDPAELLPGIPEAAPTAAPPAPVKGFFLQLGAFTTAANAEGFKAMVAEEAGWLGDRLRILTETGRYRLHAGPFDTERAAREAARLLTEALRLKPFLVLR